MFLIDNQENTNPALNLALEEYCALNLPTTHNYLLLYVNQPCLVLGKNQNTLEEINHHYTQKAAIEVLRRISGGGTVYHDLGNLNFSFLCPFDSAKVANFRWFNEPVREALRALSVPADINKRGDLVAEERKVSGNAQYTSRRMMFSHGTLLFDSDLDALEDALRVCIGQVESRSLKSVRSKVRNIKPYLPEDWTLPIFKDYLAKQLCGQEPPRWQLTNTQWLEVEELAQSKYKSWDWNFGRSPECHIKKEATRERPFGIHLHIAQGCKLNRIDLEGGQAFSATFLEELNGALQGERYARADLLTALLKLFRNEQTANLWADWLF